MRTAARHPFAFRLHPQGRSRRAALWAGLVIAIHVPLLAAEPDVAGSAAARRELPLPENRAQDHWAFQPIAAPDLPAIGNPAWIRNPVDTFILARLEAAGLQPSPEADRRTLARRAFFTLTGLPPSPDDVRRFVDDPDPDAFTKLVDRLLESPHHGEQWARHWLDVARYSDTKGYVYAREERVWPHAWAYRDWVVRAFNEDMPYDRFLLLQLAADQVEDRRPGDLAAMGFLTIGRRFLGVKHDIFDDRIDVVGRGTMGLTIGCARCHDHKYDPIPTSDYYALYGVFDSCHERLVALDADRAAGSDTFWQEFDAHRTKLDETLAQRRLESSNRARERVRDYLEAQTQLDKYPADGFDQVFQKSDLLPAFVRRWEDHLRAARSRRDPVFAVWHAYAPLPAESFASDAVAATEALAALEPGAINPIIAARFPVDAPPQSFGDVISRYAEVFRAIDGRWNEAIASAQSSGSPVPSSLDDPDAEAIRRVLHGPGAPSEVPDAPVVNIEAFFDTDTINELWKLQGEVDRAIIRSPEPVPFALTLVDRPAPVTPRIFVRGNSIDPGEEVPRRFLSLLSGEDGGIFHQGSGRLEMARAIVDPDNPLTARVIVNRVWMHHFGQGLVSTPSDFGTRADPPSHPELLDWLASWFVREGWSLRKLHRLLLLSAAWRQSSLGPADPSARARQQAADPANRLLWRMNVHRLSYEEFRDAMMAATGDLDLALGGKPADLLSEPFATRRALYGLVDRQFLPGILRTFDFANPDLHIPRRNETTVPQQALFFMNHPLVLDRARTLADRSAEGDEKDPGDPARVRRLFQHVLQRDPTPAEAADALTFIQDASPDLPPGPPPTAADWQYGIGAYDEASGSVVGFSPLPHFTGIAWQGGPNWPDPALGWAQLTAAGGHPGNDREHAAVRRWTAPRPMTIAIRSHLRHEPAQGDGIRAFIVASNAGCLAATKAHATAADLDVEPLAVPAGTTIDFVVDIGDGLDSDQFLWSVTIVDAGDAGDAAASTGWSTETDFPRSSDPPLTPWEQLAQALLNTNEFLFVD